jgi:hypothetical protein
MLRMDPPAYRPLHHSYMIGVTEGVTLMPEAMYTMIMQLRERSGAAARPGINTARDGHRLVDAAFHLYAYTPEPAGSHQHTLFFFASLAGHHLTIHD